jgi:hypothetical protein
MRNDREFTGIFWPMIGSVVMIVQLGASPSTVAQTHIPKAPIQERCPIASTVVQYSLSPRRGQDNQRMSFSLRASTAMRDVIALKLLHQQNPKFLKRYYSLEGLEIGLENTLNRA